MYLMRSVLKPFQTCTLGFRSNVWALYWSYLPSYLQSSIDIERSTEFPAFSYKQDVPRFSESTSSRSTVCKERICIQLPCLALFLESLGIWSRLRNDEAGLNRNTQKPDAPLFLLLHILGKDTSWAEWQDTGDCRQRSTFAKLLKHTCKSMNMPFQRVLCKAHVYKYAACMWCPWNLPKFLCKVVTAVILSRSDQVSHRGFGDLPLCKKFRGPLHIDLSYRSLFIPKIALLKRSKNKVK